MLQPKVFPEDRLELLGTSIHLESPESYHSRIIGLYQPRTSSGAAPSIKGKKTQTPTKKRPGIYELRNQTALGERTATFEFQKDTVLSEEILKPLCDKLLCSEKSLRELLAKKNFSLNAKISCP